MGAVNNNTNNTIDRNIDTKSQTSNIINTCIENSSNISIDISQELNISGKSIEIEDLSMILESSVKIMKLANQSPTVELYEDIKEDIKIDIYEKLQGSTGANG